MRFPITLCKDDPDEIPVAEWREVSYSRNLQSGWVLCESHRWQDFENRRPHFTKDILGTPLKTEGEASAALDTRIGELERDGWVYKFQIDLDLKTGTAILKRIEPSPAGTIVAP